MAGFLNDCSLDIVMLIFFPSDWCVYHQNDVVAEVLLERHIILLAR